MSAWGMVRWDRLRWVRRGDGALAVVFVPDAEETVGHSHMVSSQRMPTAACDVLYRFVMVADDDEWFVMDDGQRRVPARRPRGSTVPPTPVTDVAGIPQAVRDRIGG